MATNPARTADITDIPLALGFAYLVAIIHCFSRKILAWWLSNTPGTDFSVGAMEETFARLGRPGISNVLRPHQIPFIMDGKGRWGENVFVECLWRSL